MDFQLFETPFKCATFNVHKVMCMERLLGKINSYPQKQWFTLKDLWRKYQCPIKLSTGTNIAKPSCHRLRNPLLRQNSFTELGPDLLWKRTSSWASGRASCRCWTTPSRDFHVGNAQSSRPRLFADWRAL